MPTDQYHEPPEELTEEIRTFARVIASFQEEAEATSWYEQRISVETDDQARRIMEHTQREEYLRTLLFTDGDIVESAEQAEDEVEG